LGLAQGAGRGEREIAIRGITDRDGSAAGNIECCWGKREAREGETGRDGAGHQREIAHRARSLPVVCRHDDLWRAIGQVGAEQVIAGGAGLGLGD
jgi:hypothetical protein